MKSDDLLRPLMAFGAGVAVGAAVGRCWRRPHSPDRHPYDVISVRIMAADRIHALMVDVERRLVSAVDDLMTLPIDVTSGFIHDVTSDCDVTSCEDRYKTRN